MTSQIHRHRNDTSDAWDGATMGLVTLASGSKVLREA